MTSKRFSFKNLIFVFTLLLIALVIGVAGGSGIVRADSKSDAKSVVSDKYNTILSIGNLEDYNAQSVLDKIKASADYLLDNCQDAQVESLKNEKLEELDIVHDFILIGEALRDYTDNLMITNTYTDWDKDLINGYLDAFIGLLDIDKLFNANNLNRNYLENTIGNETKGEYKFAKDKIDGIKSDVEQGVDIPALKAKAKSLMDDALSGYISSGYYNDVATRQSQYDAALVELAAATLEGEINDIRSDFITSLHNSRTITERVYDTYIYYSTYPEGYTPDDIQDTDLENAIKVYQKIKQDGTSSYVDSSKFAYVCQAGTKVFDVYRTRKLNEIKNSFDRAHYSEPNLVKILRIIYDAQTKLDLAKLDTNSVSPTLAEQVKSIIDFAKQEIANVPKNVNTVTTVLESEEVLRKSKYKVTITSSNPYAFSPDAFVVANDYDFYAIKVNVNRLLRRIDVGKDANGKAQNLTVKFYINITIYDKFVIDGPNLDLDNFENFDFSGFAEQTVKDASRKYRAPQDKDGNYTETYTVSIVMDDSFEKAIGNDVKVVYYYNGQMEGYSKDQDGNYTLDQSSRNVRIEQNSQGEKVLMFETNHFSPYAICGNTTIGALFGGPIYTNPFFYIAVILLAIIFIIVLVIVRKHCKYKLIFVNNGGTRVKTRKFKNNELIEMPLENPTKHGFVFGGWFADKECKNRFSKTVMTRHKVKAYAKWNPIDLTNIEDYYKELRAYLDDFERVGPSVGFVEEDKIARIIISNDKVLLFLAGDTETYKSMGYNVIVDEHPDNQGIHNKFIIQTEEDLDKALECIDMVMDDKGLMEKEADLVIKDITPEERENGYLLSIKNDKVADDLKDYFELLRVQSKSFVLMGDGGTPRDLDGKFIVKAKKYADTIKLYLPYESEGAEKVSEVLYKDVPYMYQITDAETCANALKIIQESMLSIGMTKYPRNASLMKGAGDEDTAFGYKIKFN